MVTVTLVLYIYNHFNGNLTITITLVLLYIYNHFSGTLYLQSFQHHFTLVKQMHQCYLHTLSMVSVVLQTFYFLYMVIFYTCVSD